MNRQGKASCFVYARRALACPSLNHGPSSTSSPSSRPGLHYNLRRFSKCSSPVGIEWEGRREKAVRISAKAEYACLAIITLAHRGGGDKPVRIREIAESHGIPETFLT